jgi:hypothetical protein
LEHPPGTTAGSYDVAFPAAGSDSAVLNSPFGYTTITGSAFNGVSSWVRAPSSSVASSTRFGQIQARLNVNLAGGITSRDDWVGVTFRRQSSTNMLLALARADGTLQIGTYVNGSFIALSHSGMAGPAEHRLLAARLRGFDEHRLCGDLLLRADAGRVKPDFAATYTLAGGQITSYASGTPAGASAHDLKSPARARGLRLRGGRDHHAARSPSWLSTSKATSTRRWRSC